MKVSYHWLKDYIDTDASVETLSELLTDCGLEVEGLEKVESVKGGLKGLVVGEVLTCEDHPDSDHLHLTTVDVGTEVLDIVCGAPNVAKGQKVIVATVGTVLYQGDESFTIKKSKIRGKESFGMICAEDEIGLGNSHDGIMVLDAGAVVGTPAADYFKISTDYVIEIGLTPNRSDATSHIGVARDLVALMKIRYGQDISLQYPSVQNFKEGSKALCRIDVENPDHCPRYTGICIENVKVGPSPDFMVKRLESVGIRSINNVVDITNYVLMEMGQPLHAFDLDQVENRHIRVRVAKAGEKIVTLDGVERELTSDNLVICDEHKPMCIAGVFGGSTSGITGETTTVFLESAYFHPVSIRKTARRFGLNTDASFRYERGCDVNITEYALKRAALLMCEYAGGVIASPVMDVYPQVPKPASVELELPYLNTLLGVCIPKPEVVRILEAMEMKVEEVGTDTLRVEVPTNKVDVTRPADLAEEILRIYGYNRVESDNHLSYTVNTRDKMPAEEQQRQVSELLSHNGFSEIMNNSLGNEEYLKLLDIPEERSVRLINALSKELNVMRPSLVFGGLDSIGYNLNRKQSNLKFYEFGRSYHRNPERENSDAVEKRFEEKQHLALWMTGTRTEESWERKEEKLDFYDIKRQVEKILSAVRMLDRVQLEEGEASCFTYSMKYTVNKVALVEFGLLNAKICKHFDVKQEVFYADFDWDALLKYRSKKVRQYEEISQFPAVRRDLALLIDLNVKFRDLAAVVKRTEKSLLKEVNLFDVYLGDKLPEGKKSYALSLVFQDKEKTLTDKQIEKMMEKIQFQLKKEFAAELR